MGPVVRDRDGLTRLRVRPNPHPKWVREAALVAILLAIIFGGVFATVVATGGV
jgi:hypothetical protein